MSEQRCPRALSILLILGGSILLFATAPIVHFIDSQTARSHRREADARLRVYERQFGRSAAFAQGRRKVVFPGRDGYLLEIPRIGLRAVVLELEPEVFSGRNTPALKRYGLGQVPYTVPLRNVSPGGEGTAAITGHRTTSGAPFRYLDRLRSGDVIIIRKAAVEQQWTVTGSTTVGPRAVDAIRSRAGSRRLALLACNPPFSARERLIVYAELIEKRSAPRIEPAGRASQDILTGGAQHMRSIASRVLGVMAILNMLALSMVIAVALAHPTPSPPSPGEAPNPAPGPERPPEGAEPKPGPAPAPPSEKPAGPPEVSPPPPAPVPAPPPVTAEPQPAPPPPPAAAEPQPAPPPASQPAPAPAPVPAQPPVAVTQPAPAPITQPGQPVAAPGVVPAQPPAPSIAQAPRGPAAARPGAVVSSAAPGGPAVTSQAAPTQLPFGGPSPALSLFISVTRWVGAALVIVGIMLYTSACKRRGSSDGRAEA